MAERATIRQLRNAFPRVRKLVEQEGEVVITDQGTPKYVLTRYVPPARRTAPAAKDYVARMRQHQPRRMSASQSRALHDANRGQR